MTKTFRVRWLDSTEYECFIEADNKEQALEKFHSDCVTYIIKATGWAVMETDSVEVTRHFFPSRAST